MPNPKGVNGYGEKNYPPDDVLRESLLKYVKRKLGQEAKLARLKEDHSLSISIAMLNRIERRLGIPSVRRLKLPREDATQAILDEVDQDIAQNNGPRFVKDKLADKLILIPRQTDTLHRDDIRQVMLEHFPAGFTARYPGRKKSTIVRQSLSAIGPYHEVSADGHEKLGALALKMGDIGIPIYAYKDKWTAYLFSIFTVPDCRTVGAVGHLYLDFLEETGIAPLQLTTDKGSETGWQYAIQTAIRDTFAPEIDPEVYPSAAFLKSVHNTVIEAFWRWLREKWGINMREHILRGKNERIYVSEVPFHRDLFNWIFPPLIQSQLDEFRVYWNQHVIRAQPDKEMPSGHAPADALEHPGLFGGLDCGIRVPKEALQELREALTEEVGPRESLLAWVSPEFDQMARTVFQTLNISKITIEDSWDVFSEMSRKIETLL
ncbi:hypothetical protein DFH07DRAFT_737051 [Mycena maculata]|uniref:Integrase catalytic domain-containing protein n=1 Tax=Mycena maculata TaxID=230809 RepID=A0AAD7JKZ5_9AGAR|nr:hypothetical protein DFH07DRAFT_737051 [Mycena maculata]